jgi:hypothetical protein
MAKIKQYAFGHAFNFFYKYTPSGSDLLTSGWPNQELGSVDNQTYVLNGYMNMSVQTMLTRHTASLDSTQGALPWGSPAADYLWNVLVPTASVSQEEVPIPASFNSNFITTYTFTYNSASFMNSDWEVLPGAGGFGLTEYPITSSWIAYEPKLINSNNQYKIVREDTAGSATYFPATVWKDGDLAPLQPYATPTDFDTTVPQYAYNQAPSLGAQNRYPPGFVPTTFTYGDLSTGSHDGRFFDVSGGCGITRASVSASLVEWNTNKTSALLASRTAATAALKKRRLFFPTISTGSGGTTTAFFGLAPSMIGIGSNEYFDENGGIYNVKFNLMRDVANDFYPDSGEGSELLVFIFNVQSTIQQSGNASEPGDIGYYPPNNNIIRVKNSPAMSFLNPATGYLIESFNINVVQYGTNAQLVFEASGSLDSEKYFGCIIDDVQFCKVGVSTDPNLIKPTTTGGETVPPLLPDL